MLHQGSPAKIRQPWASCEECWGLAQGVLPWEKDCPHFLDSINFHNTNDLGSYYLKQRASYAFTNSETRMCDGVYSGIEDDKEENYSHCCCPWPQGPSKGIPQRGFAQNLGCTNGCQLQICHYLPLISKPGGFDPRCTRKMHVYMSPSSNSNSGTIHTYKISPNMLPVHSTFMTKYASYWGFTAFLGFSGPPQTSCVFSHWRFGVKCPGQPPWDPVFYRGPWGRTPLSFKTPQLKQHTESQRLLLCGTAPTRASCLWSWLIHATPSPLNHSAYHRMSLAY